MPITTAKSKKVQDMRKLLTLIYGPPKIGKSTLAAGYPGAVFIATEAGLNLLEVQRWESEESTAEKPDYVVKTWEQLLAATAEVIAAGAQTIVIDTVGNACQLAEQYVCEQNGAQHRNDGKLGFGIGATLIGNELKRYFTKLSSNGIGLVLIAHSMQRTLSTRAGEVQKTLPFIPCDNKTYDLYNMVLGMMDLVLFCDLEANGTDRVIRTKPTLQYDAGDRTGRLPDTVPMPVVTPNEAPAASFGALYTAFYGKPPAMAAKAVEGKPA